MTVFLRHAGACLLVTMLSVSAAEIVPNPGTLANPRRVSSVPAAGNPIITNAGASGFQETQPFIFPGDQQRAARPQNTRENTFSLFSLMPLFVAITIFCGLFIGALYLAKRYMPGRNQLFSHPAMEVLGRTHLDPKRYVSLVRVGKRILVLGVTQDDISSLSEITEDEEITSIMEVARPKTEMGLTIFQRLFQKQVMENREAEAAAMAQLEAEKITDQMSSLREKVRAIRESDAGAPAAQRRVDAIG